MAGWRDAISEEAQSDMDGLTEAAVDFAMNQISARDAFLPFTLAVAASGERQALAPNLPSGENPGVDELIDAQWRALSNVRGSLRAGVVAVNVSLPEKGLDAIDLTVEHREGIALNVVFPYRKKPGGYELLDPSASATQRRVWPRT